MRSVKEYQVLSLSAGLAEVAAALHASSGFPEPWSAAAFTELLAMPGTAGCLALDDGHAHGLILWRVAADEAEILTLCVPPELRRRGAGRFLLENASKAVEQAGARRLCLEVAVDNREALALYRSLGFENKGLRPGYYRHGTSVVDAEIWIKTLKCYNLESALYNLTY